MTNDTYIGAPAIRRRFGISVPTLRRWIKLGRFPKPDITVARRNKWKASTIDAFEAAPAGVGDSGTYS
jgi:predicted DNA-binding transcriptional regulator AlpA